MTPIGLAEDRRWQLIGTEERRGITQRQHRVLALVQPELLSDGSLRLSASGMPTIEIERPLGRRVTVDSHFRVPVRAHDAGDDAAAWFTEFAGVPLRLVRMNDDTGWRLPVELDVFGQGAGFIDAAPILVASQESLAWLNARASEEFGIDRFRPNLVVSGAEPWAEDSWDEFAVGEARLRSVVAWPRCAIPQIDQSTAARHKEPAKVLKANRWCVSAPSVPGNFRAVVEGNALFGIACTIGPVGSTVRVGDRLNVSSTRRPVLGMV